MIKTLTKHGNSLALVIDRPILDLLKIDANTPLEITTDGRTLTLAPAMDPAFEKALKETSDQYANVFKRLAD
jgi:antitoxin component of MazEF toxin-antitoxin module